MQPPEPRGRATVRAFLVAAAGMFAYEAGKSALLPSLSLWESHTITIIVGACTAAAVAHVALSRQARVLQALADAEAERSGLELRQQLLSDSEARYRMLVEASPEACAVHRDGILLYVNPEGLRLMGVTDAQDMAGQPVATFVHPEDHAVLMGLDPASRERLQYRLRRPDGQELYVETASVLITYEGVRALQTVFRDVTAQRRLEQQLVHEAFHDALTGLPNRALFQDRVTHALARDMRGASGTSITVLFLDLDDFKAVNDRLGHAAGDRLLVAIAERLQRATREYDTVARFGGDEFAVLLEGLVSRDEAESVIARVREGLTSPVMVEGRNVSVSASIGVAHATPDDDAHTLLRNADVAMYEAKDSGKARHAVYEPAMYASILRRLQIESDLREATVDPAASGFSLVYQPIVELDGGAVRGMEALLRWRHPQRGDVTPGEFITIAEDIGMIVPLGDWVLQEALATQGAWRRVWAAQGLDPDSVPSIGVNISGRQLQERDFVVRVADTIRSSGVPARHVTLEITESVIMQRTEETLETLRALRQLGVRLAIDDFGTGYSSLSYLQKFPVDVLKIDRAFVEGVARGGSDAALARTIIALGDTLGLRTVAEGVEDAAQHEQLRQLGCLLGQGYLFSRPLTAEQALEWMLARTGPAEARQAA